MFVAGARAFARNAAAAESIYEKTQDLGIHINPVDLPDLKDHNPNPAQKMRPVIFAYTELEKYHCPTATTWMESKAANREKNRRSGQQVRLSLKGKVKRTPPKEPQLLPAETVKG